MKIVIGTSTPFHLVHLARELAEFGYEVNVIGYMPKWKMKNYNLGKASYTCIFWNIFPLSLLALQRIFPKIQRWTTFSIMPIVDYLISKKMTKCDVFIGLSGVSMNSLKVAKVKYNAITICDRGAAHVLKQNDLIKNSKSNKLPTNYITRELNSYEEADYIIIPSFFSLNTFLEQGLSKKKIFVNNYGVNLDRFYSKDSISIKSNKINALFVGSWSYQKGVDIINKVIEVDPDFHVTHIGINNGQSIIDSRNFKSIGHVPNHELVNHYNNYDVLLLPSRQDGFGMVILEALSCGLSVIASTNTGAPDIKSVIANKNSVLIMESIDEIGLVNALKEFRLNKSFTSGLTVRDKENFTWQAYGTRYVNFIKGIVNGS